MHKKHKILAAIVIILIATPCVWYGYLYLTFEERKKVDYTYTIQIEPDLEGKYTIYLPILIPSSEVHKSKDIDEKLFENININEDNGNYSLINTEFGKMVSINGDAKILLKSQFVEKNGYYQFTGRNNTAWGDYNYHEDYWVFCNKSSNINNIKILIKYEYGNPSYNREGRVEGTIITNGWQLIKGSEVEEVV
jgi:hypothetical protein